MKEKDIEAKLSQVKGVWSGQILSLMTFKDRGELMLKGAETAEILTFLEDSLLVLGSLLSNRYDRISPDYTVVINCYTRMWAVVVQKFKPLSASNRYCAFYKAEIQDWVSKLSTSSEVIEQWVIVQNLWIYLEAVFVGGDIAKDLPQVSLKHRFYFNKILI